MEEKKPIKISLTGLFLLISLIIIVIMGMVIYNLYQNKKVTDESLNLLNEKIANLENGLNSTNTEDVVVENKVETLNKDDELVKSLYNYVLKSDHSKHVYAWQSGLEPASFYRDNKTVYASLTDMEKTLAIIANYKENELEIVSRTTLKGFKDPDIVNPNVGEDEVTVYKNVKEKAQEIFNQESYVGKDFNGCAGNLYFKDNNYYEVSYYGGGKGTGISTYSEIQKVEKDDEHIYIYDKFVYVDSDPMLVGTGDGMINVFTTADCTKKIGAEEDVNTDFYSKYEDELETFKHTFEKREDGTYFWVSTEIVK